MATYVDPRLTRPTEFRLLATAIDNMGGGGGFPDVPSDGKTYGRRNRSWQELGDASLASVAYLLDRVNHTGLQPISTIAGLQSALNSKVNAQVGMGLSQENYTTAEKQKLAGLEDSRYKGQYTSLLDLNAAFPTAAPGSYADVDGGVGQPVVRYIWDDDDAEWVAQAGDAPPLTSADVKSLYESNPDTNAFTDVDKSKLDSIPSSFGALAFKDDVSVADISASGTPSSSSFLRGDGSWAILNLTSYASLSDNTFSGVQTFGASVVHSSAVVTAGEIDLAEANFFTLTATEDVELVLLNEPEDGVPSFIIEIENGGNFIIQYGFDVIWPGGTAPILTANGRDAIAFYKLGGQWRGFLRADLR